MHKEELNVLILNYIQKSCTPEEARQVELWLAEKEENRQYFDELRFLAGRLGQPSSTFEPDTDSEWQKFLDRKG